MLFRRFFVVGLTLFSFLFTALTTNVNAAPIVSKKRPVQRIAKKSPVKKVAIKKAKTTGSVKKTAVKKPTIKKATAKRVPVKRHREKLFP